MRIMLLMLCQPEKMKPEAGAKLPGAANVNIGMTLSSTKNLAKMGTKMFAAPVSRFLLDLYRLSNRSSKTSFLQSFSGKSPRG